MAMPAFCGNAYRRRASQMRQRSQQFGRLERPCGRTIGRQLTTPYKLSIGLCLYGLWSGQWQVWCGHRMTRGKAIRSFSQICKELGREALWWSIKRHPKAPSIWMALLDGALETGSISQAATWLAISFCTSPGYNWKMLLRSDHMMPTET